MQSLEDRIIDKCLEESLRWCDRDRFREHLNDDGKEFRILIRGIAYVMEEELKKLKKEMKTSEKV